MHAHAWHRTCAHAYLRDDTVHHSARIARLPSAGGEGVDLVKKDDAWGGLSRLSKELSQLPLGLAHIGREELRPFDGEEGERAFGGHGLGKQCLARAWRAVQQHPGALAKSCREELRLLQRQLHRLEDRALRVGLAAHVLPAHIGHRRATEGRRLKLRQPRHGRAKLRPPVVAAARLHGLRHCPPLVGSLPPPSSLCNHARVGTRNVPATRAQCGMLRHRLPNHPVRIVVAPC